MPEQFPVESYDLRVSGIVFSMDLPLLQNNAASVSDKIFTSLNEEDKAGQNLVRYVSTEKSVEDLIYIIRSGVRVQTSEHDFNTYLEYKFIGNCENKSDYMHCEYHAIQGRYNVDLPAVKSTSHNQTDQQMEENEIAVLSKLNLHSFSRKETFETSSSLSKLKSNFAKLKFITAYKNTNLVVYKPSYNYTAELEQKKVNKIYKTTINYELYPQKSSLHGSDFLASYKEARKDMAKISIAL